MAIFLRQLLKDGITNSSEQREGFGVHYFRQTSELGKGEIRFQKPILGSETWPVIADETIKAGERAQIVDVLGQTLKVARK